MKYSIRRKNSMRFILKGFRPALILVSTIGLFIPGVNAAPTREPSDSLFNARNVFAKLHSNALEILPTSTRLDMLDYWDVDSIYKAMNAMGGLSNLETVTENYLKVKITPVSSLEIKILPIKKGEIAMTVYTVGDSPQAADSEIRFYDENLKELDTSKYFEVPAIKNFFEIPKGSTTKMKEIEQMIPFPTVKYTAFPDKDELKGELTVSEYINQDDWNIAKLFVKPFIILSWKKDKFKIE